MKKIATSLTLCLALIQNAHAATSALNESILEFEAIATALGTNSDFQNIISPSEFIVEIERKTHAINKLGKIKYEIETRKVGNKENARQRYTYIATLKITANPGIGPNIIEVVEIKKEKDRD